MKLRKTRNTACRQISQHCRNEVAKSKGKCQSPKGQSFASIPPVCKSRQMFPPILEVDGLDESLNHWMKLLKYNWLPTHPHFFPIALFIGLQSALATGWTAPFSTPLVSRSRSTWRPFGELAGVVQPWERLPLPTGRLPMIMS